MDEATRLSVVRNLLRQRDDLLVERVQVRADIKRLQERDSAIIRKLVDLAAASRVFDYPIAYTTKIEDFESFQSLQDVMTELRRGKLWEPGKSYPTIEEMRSRMSSPVATEKAKQPPAPAPDQGRVRIRDRVLEYLKEAGTKGAGASEIRNHLETAYGIKTHSKTVGMTLFRLSRDGLVSRDKRTWFFVSDGVSETENPGGSAPGSLEARSNLKEVET